MKVLTGHWGTWPVVEEPSAVTIGVLDGVHMGHRRLLSQLLRVEGLATVLTFDPHPAEVLVPGCDPRLITTLDERIALLETIGVGRVGVLDLTDIRDLAPEAFIDEVLVGRLRVATVVAGIDFQFGKNRAGTIATLRERAADHGYRVETLHLVETDGVISSSRIRGLIESGRIAEANLLLASRYRMSGVVIAGDRRGREIGFPTANLAPPERKVVPGNGVYAVWAHLSGERHAAAVNIGVRPTFGEGGPRLIEAHLLDWSGEIYGESVTLEFVSRIRDEVRFESVEDLIDQMNDDVARVRGILGVSGV